MTGATFYWSPNSTAVITQAVIAEVGLEHKRVPVNITKGETKEDSFKKLNPNGRVPVLEIDGITLWESAAITIYLGEQYGVSKGLFPEAGPQRGEALKWIIWSNVNLATAASHLGQQLPDSAPGAVEQGSKDFISDHAKDELALQRARDQVDQLVSVLDGQLKSNKYVLSSGKYSLVDTHLWSVVSWVSMLQDLSKFTNVQTWVKTVKQRDFVKQL